jgi:hypothetical protein
MIYPDVIFKTIYAFPVPLEKFLNVTITPLQYEGGGYSETTPFVEEF